MKQRVEFYQSKDGRWHWRFLNEEETIAVCPDGFKAKEEAEQSFSTLQQTLISGLFGSVTLTPRENG